MDWGTLIGPPKNMRVLLVMKGMFSPFRCIFVSYLFPVDAWIARLRTFAFILEPLLYLGQELLAAVWTICNEAGVIGILQHIGEPVALCKGVS